ncbi:MAG: Crp/Fnr family transcriptional regulator [Acidimicrobiia bacterium]|nr:Crp/Fnr family transcriptional regulator [Acidimicrobiia bacterium]
MATRRRTPLTIESNDPHVCTPDVRQHVLAHVAFFRDLTADEIVDIDRHCRVEDFDAGNAVHLAGQPARRLFVVATGSAKLTRSTLDGVEVLLDVLLPGDHFGALPVLGSDAYTDSVWALTPLCVLSLDIDAFDDILDHHPSVARAGLGVMARRLEGSRSQAYALAAATAEQRVAAALVMLAARTGVRRAGGTILLDLPLSRDDLAALTGTASESVSRTLARLKRDGLIDTGRRWVTVRDLAALEQVATI